MDKKNIMGVLVAFFVIVILLASAIANPILNEEDFVINGYANHIYVSS